MRRLLLLLGVVAIGGVVALAVGYQRLDQSPFADTPRQLHVCGRTYVLPAPQGITREAVDAQGLSVQGHVRTWQGRKAVWGTHSSSNCGLNVYLEVSRNDFRGFNLSGTP